MFPFSMNKVNPFVLYGSLHLGLNKLKGKKGTPHRNNIIAFLLIYKYKIRKGYGFHTYIYIYMYIWRDREYQS